MISKATFILAIWLLGIEVSFAQELRVNQSFADSIERMDRKVGWELHAILLYNDAVKSFVYTDTIKITKNDSQYNYYYKDSIITDLRYNQFNEQRLVILHYSSTPSHTFLHSTTQQSLSNRFELFVRDAPLDKKDLVYRLSHFLHDVQMGRYEERTKSGKVLVTGQYCQIDSMYSDTLLYLNPETYEDILEIIPRTKFAVKTGVWYYYTPEGILTKEEKYNACK